MKKFLFTCGFIFLLANISSAQCVSSCSNYAVSPITYSPLSTVGNNAIPLFSPNADDGIIPYSIPLGFTFNFYCTNYTAVTLGSNGFINFDLPASINAATTQVSQVIPSTTPLNNFIAFNWNDLDPGAGGSVTYTTVGTSPNRKFIYSFTGVPIWATTLLNTGQIILYETSNEIEIHTTLINSNSANLASQGIENLSGSLGVASPSINNALYTGSNFAYKFSNIIGTPPTGLSGPTGICLNSVNNYTCNTMPGATSYSWSAPAGWIGTSTVTAATFTVGMPANVSVTATYSCGTSLPATFSVYVLPPPTVSIPTATPATICSGSVVTLVGSGAVSYTLLPGNLVGPSPFTVTPQTSTTYSLIGTDANGCVSVNSALASINVVPSPTVSVNSGSICLGASFNFVPSGANSYSYSTLFSQVTPTAAGNYSYLVIGLSNNGCLGTAVSSVTVNPLPTVFASATRTSFCINENTTLNVTGASTYSWSVGSTSASLNYSSAIPNPANIITVIGTNSLGCQNTGSISLKVNSCVGITETQNQLLSFDIYPNPSNGVFYFYKSNTKTLTLSVCNALGEVIKKVEAIENKTEINLNNYPSGLYFIKSNENNGITKIVKTE
jgi:hypothetical protein